MNKYYFTFGSNTSLCNSFVCVEAVDMQTAREEIIKRRGKLDFAFGYDEESLKGLIERFNLFEVAITEPLYKLTR